MPDLICGCARDGSRPCPEHIFPLESPPLRSCFEVGSEQTAAEEDRITGLLMLGERDGGGNRNTDWSPALNTNALEEEMEER